MTLSAEFLHAQDEAVKRIEPTDNAVIIRLVWVPGSDGYETLSPFVSIMVKDVLMEEFLKSYAVEVTRKLPSIYERKKA